MLIFLSMLESDNDRELFAALYNQYGSAMLRVAKRYFPDDGYTAEDVVQNAWVRVVNNFQRISSLPSNKYGAYLVVIVKNEAITILRRKKQELPFEDAIIGNDDRFAENDERSIIEVIQSMPDTYRAVLEMRFIEERSTREISKALSNNIEIHYENEEGDILRFEYVRVEEGSAILIDTENMQVENVTVNGCPGHLYISADEEQSSCITWYDDEAHIQFVIDGFFEKDLLMKMACSVSKCSGRV